jgi:O-antigen/teichoic acid export membrane protein
MVGMIVPLAVTIVTVPRYLHVLGEARFGVLSLLWLIFGYFGLFDFGLSRATANRLSKLRNGDARERGLVFHTALAMNAGIGVIAGVVFYFVMLPLLGHFSHGSAELVTEVRPALPWIATLIPLALVGGVFIGALEAEERFLTLNIQQIVGMVLLQCLPLSAVLLFKPDIEIAVIGTAAARIFSVCWSAWAAWRAMNISLPPKFSAEMARSLLKYGGSVAITNFISPILVSIDQFLIASLLGAKAVAHYAVPFSVAMKTLIVPTALTRAMFPRLSSLHGEAASALADNASQSLVGVMALICAPAILLAHLGLSLWVGADFAAAAAPVAQILLVGAWVNSIGYIPYALLQGQGRPGVVAKFHALELVPFVAILWLCVVTLGLPGAALAWTLRTVVDVGLLLWASGYRLQRAAALLSPTGVTVAAAWLCAVLLQPKPIIAIVLAFLFAAAITGWILLKVPLLRKLANLFFRRLSSAGNPQ